MAGPDLHDIRGVIFDMDGTLLDSMSVWETLGADYLRTQGIEPRPGLREQIRNMSMREVARYYQSAYGLQLSEIQIISGINALLMRFYRDPGGAQTRRRRTAENACRARRTHVRRHGRPTVLWSKPRSNAPAYAATLRRYLPALKPVAARTGRISMKQPGRVSARRARLPGCSRTRCTPSKPPAPRVSR